MAASICCQGSEPWATLDDDTTTMNHHGPQTTVISAAREPCCFYRTSGPSIFNAGRSSAGIKLGKENNGDLLPTPLPKKCGNNVKGWPPTQRSKKNILYMGSSGNPASTSLVRYFLDSERKILVRNTLQHILSR